MVWWIACNTSFAGSNLADNIVVLICFGTVLAAPSAAILTNLARRPTSHLFSQPQDMLAGASSYRTIPIIAVLRLTVQVPVLMSDSFGSTATDS
jgi:hypothetical protein